MMMPELLFYHNRQYPILLGFIERDRWFSITEEKKGGKYGKL